MKIKGGYVDLFLLPVPRKKLGRYKKMARGFARFVKKQPGVLDYREFLGTDLVNPGMTPFTKYFKPKPGEGLVGAYVLYRSKTDRDRLNRVMLTDPAFKEMVNQPMPFDMKRMCYGGFKTFIAI